MSKAHIIFVSLQAIFEGNIRPTFRFKSEVQLVSLSSTSSSYSPSAILLERSAAVNPPAKVFSNDHVFSQEEPFVKPSSNKQTDTAATTATTRTNGLTRKEYNKIVKEIEKLIASDDSKKYLFSEIWSYLERLGWKHVYAANGFYPYLPPWTVQKFEEVLHVKVTKSFLLKAHMLDELVAGRDYFLWTTGTTEDAVTCYLRKHGVERTDDPINDSRTAHDRSRVNIGHEKASSPASTTTSSRVSPRKKPRFEGLS
jgi:hypothetical protein